MKKNIKKWVLACLLILISGMASAKGPKPKGIQHSIREVISRAGGACVKICRYDSTGKNKIESFSGVIVSADGLVLTAAHAEKTGCQYTVELPDGRSLTARGLGRIPVVDAAMIRIISPGTKLPYCKMGSSGNLVPGQPCISIAFPASLPKLQSPTARLGYVIRPVTAQGKIQTSCLMEPGDSGGPLFDLNGMVIAIHSKIDSPLDANMENPINNYKKYWTELLQEKSYPDDIFPDTGGEPFPSGKTKRVPDSFLPEIGVLGEQIQDRLKNSIVIIRSNIGALALSCWGTVVSVGNGPAYSYLVSKSTLVGENPVFMDNEGKRFAAKIVKRDYDNDLVLLSSPDLPMPVRLGSFVHRPIADKEPGDLIFSPSPIDSLRTGIIGNLNASVDVFAPGSFGLICEEDSTGPRVIGFSNSIPQKYGFKVGDMIDSLNGKKVVSGKNLKSVLSVQKPGDRLYFSVTRSGQSTKIDGMVGKQVKIANKHLADTFPGGQSTRSEEFNRVFVHDSMVRAEECGGPVIDINGNMIGLNISRLSRTSNLGIPIDTLLEFLPHNPSLLQRKN